MPLFETNPKNNQQPSLNQTDSGGAETPQPTPPVTETKPNNLITTIGQLLPLAPLVFEQFTGQKVPHLSGTMAEVISSLQQIQISLQVVVNNQQSLSQRLTALETNATNHLTNLTKQFQSLRLTHTKEQKQIELNPPALENQEY